MRGERSILHFNVADFAVAVERVADSSLKSRPVIVAPLQAARTVVYDMSDEAYHDGVRKGMVLSQARRLCRQAAVVAPRVDLYRKAMQGLLKEVRGYSPLVEHGLEDGHLFVDVTGTHRLFGPAPDVGLRVWREVRSSLGLNPIWALASNKLVAKVASRLVKPVGEYIVAAGEEEDFLAPLAVSLLPGLRSGELRQLQEFRIITIGQLADLSPSQLMVPFGSRSGYLHDASRGRDAAGVQAESQEEDVVEFNHRFTTDTNDQQEVEGLVAELAGRACAELRRRRQEARRVGIWLHYSDGGQVVRQGSVRRGSSSDFVLRQLALSALERAWLRRTRLRTVRMVCDRLHMQSPQLPLFPETEVREQRREKLLSAMDVIRSRFGHGLIGAGRRVGASSGPADALAVH